MPQRVLVQGKRVGIVYAEQSAASFLGKGPDRGPAGPRQPFEDTFDLRRLHPVSVNLDLVRAAADHGQIAVFIPLNLKLPPQAQQKKNAGQSE